MEGPTKMKKMMNLPQSFSYLSMIKKMQGFKNAG